MEKGPAVERRNRWENLTNSMDQSISGEATRFLFSQEFRIIIWKPKVHCRIHKSSPTVTILSNINPIHAPNPTSYRSILILSYNLNPRLPSGLFPSGLPTKTLYAILMSPICASCTGHIILLVLSAE